MQEFLLWGELGKLTWSQVLRERSSAPCPAQEHPSHLLQRDGGEVPEPDPWKRGRKAGKRRGKAARLMRLSRRGRFSVSSLKFLCVQGYFGSQKLLDSLEARGGRLPGFALTRFPCTAVCAISSGAALSKEDILSIKKKSVDDEYGFGLRLSDEILSEVQRSHYPSVCGLPGTSGGFPQRPLSFLEASRSMRMRRALQPGSFSPRSPFTAVFEQGGNAVRTSLGSCSEASSWIRKCRLSRGGIQSCWWGRGRWERFPVPCERGSFPAPTWSMDFCDGWAFLGESWPGDAEPRLWGPAERLGTGTLGLEPAVLGDRVTLLPAHREHGSGWAAPGGRGFGAMHGYRGSFLMPLSLPQHFLEIVCGIQRLPHPNWSCSIPTSTLDFHRVMLPNQLNGSDSSLVHRAGTATSFLITLVRLSFIFAFILRGKTPWSWHMALPPHSLRCQNQW